MTNYSIKSKKALIALLVAISILACKERPDLTTSEGRGKYYATVVKREIQAEYFNCYPLNKSDKKQCIQELNKKYLKEHLSDIVYLTSFQYEAEKLGFKHFLNGVDKECESVNYGPEYDHKEEAYLVKCMDDKIYYMEFDYQNRLWKLKDE